MRFGIQCYSEKSKSLAVVTREVNVKIQLLLKRLSFNLFVKKT